MWCGWKTCCPMTCKSTATSTCIWQQFLLLVLQRDLARLPLREDLLHRPVQVQSIDRVVDLRRERVALSGRDALGRGEELRVSGLDELPVGRPDVIEDGRCVRSVGGHLAGLNGCHGACV